jgi:hypothetical protein
MARPFRFKDEPVADEGERRQPTEQNAPGGQRTVVVQKGTALHYHERISTLTARPVSLLSLIPLIHQTVSDSFSFVISLNPLSFISA